MRALALLFVAMLLLPGMSPARAADDPLPVGANFTGLLKRFGLPNDAKSLVSTHETRLKVTRRDGEKFTAELWIKTDDAPVGWQIDGTVSERGGIKFTATKRISKEAGPGDILGQIEFLGAVKQDKIDAKYTLPNKVTPGKQRKIPRHGQMTLTRSTDNQPGGTSP